MFKLWLLFAVMSVLLSCNMSSSAKYEQWVASTVQYDELRKESSCSVFEFGSCTSSCNCNTADWVRPEKAFNKPFVEIALSLTEKLPKYFIRNFTLFFKHDSYCMACVAAKIYVALVSQKYKLPSLLVKTYRFWAFLKIRLCYIACSAKKDITKENHLKID